MPAVSKDKFEYIIQAYDKTAGPFNSVVRRVDGASTIISRRLTGALTAPFRALSSLKLFAFGSNVQMLGGMVAGAVRGLRAMTEEYARSEVVSQEFGRRTGTTGNQIYALSKRLQEAAKGAIVLDDVMEMANASMARGVNVQQLAKVWEFASVKAKTTREDFKSLAETISTALATGRAMSLQRVGLLTTGLKGVAEAYESAHAGMKWSNLSAGQQKAAILNQALREMDDQLKRIGLTGNEAVFGMDRLLSAADDVMDTIRDLIVSSPVIGQAVERVRALAYEVRDALTYGFDNYRNLIAFVTGSAGSSLGRVAKMIGSVFGAAGGPTIQGTFNKIASAFGRAGLVVVSAFEQAKYVFLELLDIAGVFGHQLMMAMHPLLSAMLTVQRASDDVRKQVADAWLSSVRGMRQLSEWTKGQKPAALAGIAAARDDLERFDRLLKGLPASYDRAAQAAEKMLNVKAWLNLIPQVWKDLGEGMGSRMSWVGKALGDAAKAASSTTDRLRDAFEKAASRVREAADKLKAAHERLLEVRETNATRRYEVALAQAGGPGTPMGRMLTWRESGRHYDSSKAATDTATRLAELARAQELMQQLATDRAVYMNPYARRRVGGVMEMLAGESERVAGADVTAKQRELGLATAARDDAMSALGQKNWDKAVDVAVKGLREVASGANELRQALGDTARAALMAGKALLGGSAKDASELKELGVTGGL